MRETERYKLKLVEMSDTFSTQPLNENMTAVDSALGAVNDAAKALTNRVAALERHHIAAGTYEGGGSHTFNLGFQPVAVVIGGGSSGVIVRGGTTNGSISETGFTVLGGLSISGRAYQYLAID